MSWDALSELVKVLGLPLTLALIGVWALATGRVIPRSTHEATLKDRDDQIQKLEAREQMLLDMLLPATRGLEQATAALREKRKA